MNQVVDIKVANDSLTEAVIGCAITVHKTLGLGLLESIYEHALAIELQCNNMPVKRQYSLPVHYRDEPIGDFRVDLLVCDELIVELKSVERHDPVFEAQLLTYMKLSGIKTGLLINFNKRLLKDGIVRRVL